MGVSVVSDSVSDIERFIVPTAPDSIRNLILGNMPKGSTRTKSTQMILTDSFDGKVSILVDNMHALATVVVEGGSCTLTAHDAVRIRDFWNSVVVGMT